MNIKPCHKALEQMLFKSLKLIYIKADESKGQQIFQCYDSDDVQYIIEELDQKFFLSMICIDLQKIWNHCQKHFTTKYYSEFKISLSQCKYRKALRIEVDLNLVEKFIQNFKDESQSEILKGKKKLEAVFAEISRRLACIKRHFFASSFEMMLYAVKSNAQTNSNIKIPNLCYRNREKQKIWLAFGQKKLTVIYGMHFEDEFQILLAEKLFTDLRDVKPPGHDKLQSVEVYSSQLSNTLISSFPQQKGQTYNFSNGIVSINLFGHLINAPERAATFLAGFRNYVSYHIQSQKAFLHARLLRRISQFKRGLGNSQIEKYAIN